MKKFCPKCGASIKEGVFCKDCKEIKLEFKPIKVKLCPSKRYFFKGKWVSFSNLKSLTEKLLKENVKQKVSLREGLEVYEGLLEKPGLKKTLDVIVSFGKEEFLIPIGVEVTYSPGVAKLGTTYFEGILQLRNARPEVKEYIKKYFVKNASKKVFVNNVVEKKDSVDYYFVTKHHIMPLANKLIRNFGGFASQNPQLFSHNKQTSKDLFRLNVLVTVPNFKVGDVVLFDDKLCLVTGLNKQISSLDLKKNKKFVFSFDEKNQEEFKVVKKQKTTVSTVKPSLEIIHPDNYQAVPCENPLKLKLKPGQKVVVVNNKKDFFVIK